MIVDLIMMLLALITHLEIALSLSPSSRAQTFRMLIFRPDFHLQLEILLLERVYSITILLIFAIAFLKESLQCFVLLLFIIQILL
jgi:hypothetical protein